MDELKRNNDFSEEEVSSAIPEEKNEGMEDQKTEFSIEEDENLSVEGQLAQEEALDIEKEEAEDVQYVEPEDEERYLLRLAKHRRIKKIALISVASAIVLAALIWLIVLKVTTVDLNSPAVTIGGEKVPLSEYAFQYFTSVDYYASNNSSNLTTLGLDIEGDLRTQSCGVEGYEGKSWHEYFVDQTNLALQSTVALAAEAKKEGISIETTPSVQESIDNYMASLESYATQYGITTEQLIETNYGGLCTEEGIRAALERVFLAQAYMSQKLDSYEFSGDEIQAFYDENKRSLDTVSYRVMLFSDATSSSTDESSSSSASSSTEESQESSDTSEESQAQDGVSNLTAKEKAERMLAQITDEQSFIDASTEYCDPEKLESYQDGSATLSTGIYASQFNETAAADWLFDDARKEGDVTILDLQAGYAVTYFIERVPDESYTVDVRHVLIQPEQDSEGNSTDEQKSAAKAQAEELYQEWMNGEKTEDSFAQMAKDHSVDGNASEGGLYEGVYTGQMVATFNDWCFDSSRQPGDSGIVETDYGYHIMYFVGKSGPAWKENSLTILQNQKYADFEDSLVDSYPVIIHDSVLNKITR